MIMTFTDLRAGFYVIEFYSGDDDYFEDVTFKYYRPAWIIMGDVDCGNTFLMCIDPESKEFGDLKTFHNCGDPECIKMVCDESNHENGE